MSQAVLPVPFGPSTAQPDSHIFSVAPFMASAMELLSQVIVVAPDVRIRDSILDALDRPFRRFTVNSSEDVGSMDTYSPGARVVLLLGLSGDEAGGRVRWNRTLTSVRTMRRRFPTVPAALLVYGDSDLATLHGARVDLDQIVRVPSASSIGAVARVADRLLKNALPRELLGPADDDSNHFVRALESCAARQGGWEDARHMIARARLIQVAAALELNDLTCRQASERLEFKSTDALRKFVRRTAGVTWSEFMEASPLSVARATWRSQRTVESRSA